MEANIVERIRSAFSAEAFDLLGELDTALLALESAPQDGDLVHRVFRAIHTIKGSGATAGFTHLAAVAHQVEEAFDLARSGRLAITGELIDCGLKACDILRTILTSSDESQPCPGEAELGEAVARLVPRASAGGPADAAPAPDPAAGGAAPETAVAYEIVLRPHRNLFYSGTDPVTLLDELRALGHAHILAHTDEVPPLFDLDAESCYLGWDIRLVTEAGEEAIRQLFAFVEDDISLRIRLIEDQTSAVALLTRIPAESLDLFAAECQEHLEQIEHHALALEAAAGGSADSLNAVFRAVHSLKGNAALLLGQLAGDRLTAGHPLSLLARMAHAVESQIEPHREVGAPPVPPGVVALLLEARDAMQGLVEGTIGWGPPPVVPKQLLAQLGLKEETAAPPRPIPRDAAFANTAGQCLEIFENCLRELSAGQVSDTTLKTYERGLKTLTAAAVKQRRTDLDEPLSEQLRILDAALRGGRAVTEEDCESLRRHSEDVRNRVHSTPPAKAPGAAARPPAAPAAEPAASPQAGRNGAASAAATTIRIDQEKLDRLMRVVGELLVAKNSFPTLAARAAAGEDPLILSRLIKEASAGISRIAEEMQASVMAIRMLPVKTVFQRFPRLVRDLARNLGKQVNLSLEGENTALDKTILEQIADPLVHLVRNAIDHGIEGPEQRQKAGKPAAGNLRLRAGNEAGNVVIQIEDDGGGLNTLALKQKAVSRGLLAPEAAEAMSHAEACRLIFLPGLSTAEKVTEISGRGVGMDVVRNNIEELHGSIEIESSPGAGTTFTIKLPTSLIVSRGILLEVSGQEYILPLTAIADMVKLPATSLRHYAGHRMAQIRGEVYSLFSLAESFGLPTRSDDELSVALIEAGKLRYGLIADRFISEVEVVLKPLPAGLEQCREFHGAAILGDGRVVLVLNPQECHRAEAGERR